MLQNVSTAACSAAMPQHHRQRPSFHVFRESLESPLVLELQPETSQVDNPKPLPKPENLVPNLDQNAGQNNRQVAIDSSAQLADSRFIVQNQPSPNSKV